MSPVSTQKKSPKWLQLDMNTLLTDGMLLSVHDHQTSVQPACITCRSFTKMESTIRNFTIPFSLKHFGIKMKLILLPKLFTRKFIPDNALIEQAALTLKHLTA